MSYLTGMLCAHHTVSNSRAFLRGEERQSMTDQTSYNQKFEPIGNSYWWLVLSCVLIFTSEALCISCFPSPVENGFIECGTAVKKTTFNLRDNTSTGLEQRSSDAKHRKTYGDCLNQGWISYSFRFLLHLVNFMPRFRDFQQRTSEEGTNNQGFAAGVGAFGEVARDDD